MTAIHVRKQELTRNVKEKEFLSIKKVKYSTAIKTQARGRVTNRASSRRVDHIRVVADKVVSNVLRAGLNKVETILISDATITDLREQVEDQTGRLDQADRTGPNALVHLLSAVAKTRKSIKKKYRKKSGKRRPNLREQVVAERA